MAWFAQYRRRLLNRIYDGSPYGGPDKLEVLWPFFLGLGIAMIADLAFTPRESLRLAMAALLAGPGAIWLIYVSAHDLNALRLWVKERRGKP